MHINHKSMKTLIIFASTLTLLYSAPQQDLMTKVPGYAAEFNTSVYSGYLQVADVGRALHYVFVQSKSGGNNSDPVLLWLNGGPGCSSLLGFLQEIGPYFLPDGANYKSGDNLQQNPYSWHNLANLIFLQSPAGVGFSYNTDTQYVYDDANTAQDNLDALLTFFKKYPEYISNPFWIAGESYAGKYIPDLARKIDIHNNADTGLKIKLKGILVGNGIMTFETLFDQETQYYVDHYAVDPEIVDIWRISCQRDPDSARCRLFQRDFQRETAYINPYNVYGYCFYDESSNLGTSTGHKFETQASMLFKHLSKQTNTTTKYNGAPCAYFDGVYNYFSLNREAYHAAFPNQKWNGPCAENISYHIDMGGSIDSYRYLLSRTESKYRIVLYNGNWDDVVPFRDTLAGIGILGLEVSSLRRPWFTNEQHSGFIENYNGLSFITIKGASHQVPQAKRAESFNMLQSIIVQNDEVNQSEREGEGEGGNQQYTSSKQIIIE